jgi:hypothetical protein
MNSLHLKQDGVFCFAELECICSSATLKLLDELFKRGFFITNWNTYKFSYNDERGYDILKYPPKHFENLIIGLLPKRDLLLYLSKQAKLNVGSVVHYIYSHGLYRPNVMPSQDPFVPDVVLATSRRIIMEFTTTKKKHCILKRILVPKSLRIQLTYF